MSQVLRLLILILDIWKHEFPRLFQKISAENNEEIACQIEEAQFLLNLQLYLKNKHYCSSCRTKVIE